MYLTRLIGPIIQKILMRGKSVLLLGPRQTGKTTLIQHQINPDLSYSFAQAAIRLRYEKNPVLLEAELNEQIKQFSKPPLIFLDEIQKLPGLMDVVQHIIDEKRAQFILSGSSAHKLKHGTQINLLPGRIVTLTLSGMRYAEINSLNPALEDLLLYGSLPGIITENDNEARDLDLHSYVMSYLEEEIRAEALVRNVGNFSRFLEIAAGESGKQVNFSRISQDIGVSDTTVTNYYQILEDCLIIIRIDPIVKSSSKRRLIKSAKYIFFDLGIRRACSNEGTKLSPRTLGELFEQYVGIELYYLSQIAAPGIKLRYWRDVAGPEVDYVLDIQKKYIPIEVKWSDKPSHSDAKHLHKFLEEHPEAEKGYIVCRTPNRYDISDNITVIPWQEISQIFSTKSQ